jgi:deoxycytidylate deaminase
MCDKKDVIILRLQKHDLYMYYAQLASKVSTCHNKSEGALLLIGNLQFIGYTGNLPKQKHCKDIYNEKQVKFPCNCKTAEFNAIAQVVKSQYPVSTFNGGTMYTTDMMDIDKANDLVSMGITEVIYGKANKDVKSVKELNEFAKYNNLKLICYDDMHDISAKTAHDLLAEINSLISFKNN